MDEVDLTMLHPVHGSTSKDELPEPRGSLANDIPSRTKEQANQEAWQDGHHSQHVSNA